MFQIVAGVAPVLFFAVSGVTTTLQVKRRSFSSLLGFYVLFAVIGFAYNLMWRPDVQAFRIMDVPQIIALGVLTVYLLEKVLKPRSICICYCRWPCLRYIRSSGTGCRTFRLNLLCSQRRSGLRIFPGCLLSWRESLRTEPVTG